MSTPPRTFVQTLIGAIPAEEGAALMARAGDVARIMSSAGNVEVGGIALTADAIDELCVQLLPPDQLQTFRESGTGQAEFVTADGASAFAVLAAATDGDRWIEVRRRVIARSQLPSEETLVAELLSRSFSTDAKTAAPTPVKAAPVPVAPAVPEPAVVTAAAPEPAVEPAVTGHDLDVPANFPFANDKFDADDLTLPGGLLDEPAAAAAPPEPARPPQAKTPASVVVPSVAAAGSLADRLRAYGRLSIVLPAIIVLVVGLPSAGWFMWVRRSTPAPVASAPPPRPILKSRRLRVPIGTLPLAAVAPVAEAPVAVQNASAPVATKESPSPVTPAVNRIPAAGFSIQVAAVHERDEADRMAARLVQEGYSSYVVSGEGAAAGFYRVRIGAFPDRQGAEDVARRLERADGTKAWIVKEGRP